MSVLKEDEDVPLETVRKLPMHLGGWEQDLSDNGRDPKTVRLYRATMLGFLKWHGDRPLSRAELHAFVRFLQLEHRADGADHAGLRPRTIRRTFTAMRSFWRYAKAQGIELPAIESITLPRLDTARRRVPSDSEMRMLFGAASRVGGEARSAEWREWLRARAGCVLALLAGCALRRGEMLALDVSDLRETPTGFVVQVRRGKMGGSRIIPLADEHVEAVRRWLKIHQIRAERLGHDATPLLLDDKGHRCGQHSLDSLWETLLELAGLEGTGLTCHGCRHWAATSIIKRSNIKVAQAFLGHQSPTTTLLVYSHASADDLREAASGLAGSIHAPVDRTQKVSRDREPVPDRGPSRRVRRSARHMLGR